jgi:hypothetical protein
MGLFWMSEAEIAAELRRTYAFRCPTCKARAGDPCSLGFGFRKVNAHEARTAKAGGFSGRVRW